MSRRRATSQPPPRRVSAPLSFVGRDRELTELREHLAGAPLVVLYGPIGAGKTSLVEQLALALDVTTTHVRCFPGERGGAVKSRAERRLRCPPGGLSEALVNERSEEHTSELQSRRDLVCRLL